VAADPDLDLLAGGGGAAVISQVTDTTSIPGVVGAGNPPTNAEAAAAGIPLGGVYHDAVPAPAGGNTQAVLVRKF
jgi:hypothetical protein